MIKGLLAFAVLCISIHSVLASGHRLLEFGDFAGLNAVLSGAVIYLGDTSVASGIIVNLSLRNIRCSNFAVHDMSIATFRRTDQATALVTDVVGISMDCTMEYDYRTLFFVTGSGHCSVQFNSTASATAVMESVDFNQYPPTSSFLESCAPSVDLYNLQFLDGGILALAPVESLIASVVEGQAEKAICQQLGELSTSALVQLLVNAKNTLDRYPAGLEVDPLIPEMELLSSQEVELLNFQERDTDMGKLFDLAMHNLIKFLSKDVTADDGTVDMQANTLLRDKFLVDRALVLNISDFSFVKDGILWNKVDKLTETTIYLNSVKLRGLDTLTKFEPLETIANHTVRNQLSWEYLMLELNATVDIKPSRAPDSVIVNPGPENVVEQITIKVGFEMVDAIASVLLALDKNLLENIQLGSLLEWNSLLACLLSTIVKTEISELSISLLNVQEPTLEGFVSPGVDRIITDSVLAAFQMYEAALLTSTPAFFQIAVRAAINEVIATELWNMQSSGGTCPTAADVEYSVSELVDFRDLFLEPESAVAARGNGTKPYGDVMFSIFSRFVSSLITVDESGSPRMNSAIRSATKSQSGVEGQFNITKPITWAMQDSISLESLMRRVELISKSISISNVDSVILPLQLLDITGAHKFANSIRMGQSSGRQLMLSSDVLFQIEGEKSPLALSNTFEVSLSFASHLSADFIVTVLRKQLFEFPLKNLVNPWCWLAVIPEPEVDEEGNILDRSPHRGLQLSKLGMSIDDLDLNLSCISCTSYGGEALSEIVESLRTSGTILLIQKHVQPIWNELSQRYWDSLDWDKRIITSRKTCPHSPYFDSSVDSSFVWPGIPDFSRDSIESMVVFSVIAVNFGMVLAAESHLLRPTEPTEQLSGEEIMQPPIDGDLIDWRNLGLSIGKWATSILDDARIYVGGIVEDEESGESDLQANVLVRNLLQDGIFSVAFVNMTLSDLGMRGNLTELRLVGLDSMMEADILDVIGASTLGNRLLLKSLHLELDVAFQIENSVETLTFSFGFNEVDVDFSLLLAVDRRKLGTLRVGSMLKLKKVLPCILSKLHATNFTQLLVRVDSVQEPQVHGFLTSNVSLDLGQTSLRFLNQFTDDVIASIPKISDVTIRQVLNSFLLALQSDDSSTCTLEDMPSSDGTIDFRDFFLAETMAEELGGKGGSPYGDSFRTMYQYLQNQFSRASSEHEIFANDLIRPITLEQSGVNGSLVFPGELFNMSGTVTLSNWVVSMEGRLSDIRLENLDTMGQPLGLLQPVRDQASVLNNTLSVGVGNNPFRLQTSVYVALSDNNELNLSNEIDVVLEVYALQIVLTVLLAMSESSFFALTLDNLQDVNCWLSTIPVESLDENTNISSWFQYRISADKANLNISCVSCNNPLFSELVEMLYKPGETKQDVQLFLDNTKEMIDSFLGSNFLQGLIRMVVSDAEKLCPSSPAYDANASKGEFWYDPKTYVGMEASSRDKQMEFFNVANAVIAFVLAIGVLLARSLIRRENQAWLERLSPDQVDIVHCQDLLEAAKQEYINSHTGSMFQSEQIPRNVRYAVPVVLIFNIAMYLVAHVALLCYVNINGQIAGEQFTVEHYLDFTFFGGATTTYSNGGNEMALFLFLLSGVWPYVKLLGALWIWFAKPDLLSVARRGKIFLWMDELTKLSIIDIITMLIAVAAVLVYIGGPVEEIYGSDDLYGLALVVVPQVGFYCILIAQRLNRVSSRFFLDYHYKIVSAASEEFRRLRQAQLLDHEVDVKLATTVSTVTVTATASLTTLNTPKIDLNCEYNLGSSNGGLPLQTSVLLDGSVTFDEEDSVFTLDSQSRKHSVGEAGNFLIYDPNDRFDMELLSDDGPHSCMSLLWRKWTQTLSTSLRCPWLQGRRRILGGSVSAGFAMIFIVILFIIGCALAPAMIMNAKSILSIALESGRTYADAVDDFNMFYTVSLVLLKTRFILQSTSDYVGLGILLVLAGITCVAFPIAQGWKAFQQHRIKRKQGLMASKAAIPGFTNRLKVWNHMEVFVISFCIACWQLGAVMSYLIHNYCDSLRRLYEGLSYVGLVEHSEANCFRSQIVSPFTLSLLIGSFIFLVVSFIVQAHGQIKINKQHIQELDDERCIRPP